MQNTLSQGHSGIPSNNEGQQRRNKFFIELSNQLEASFGLSLGEVFSPDEMLNISFVYSLADLMHHDQKRKTGNQRGYIEHIQDVTLLVIKNSKGYLDIKTSLGKEKLKKRLIIALLHDLIEDTGVSQEVIGYLFGEDIACSVGKLTKTSWIHFIEKLPGIQLTDNQKELLSRAGISSKSSTIFISLKDFHNKKGTLNKLLPLFSSKNISLCFVYENTDEHTLFVNDSLFQNILTSQKVSFSTLSHQERDFDMKKIIGIFDSVKNICRQMRNEEYHGRLYFLDDDKLCDRQSNLSDLAGMGFEHEIRMLKETNIYYLSENIRYRFPHMYKIISQSVSKNIARLGNISAVIESILEFRGISSSVKRICNFSKE